MKELLTEITKREIEKTYLDFKGEIRDYLLDNGFDRKESGFSTKTIEYTKGALTIEPSNVLIHGFQAFICKGIYADMREKEFVSDIQDKLENAKLDLYQAIEDLQAFCKEITKETESE